MTRSQNEMDDLKNLKREAEELREKRKRARSGAKPEKDEQPVEESPETAAGDEDQPSEPDEEMAGLAVHVDSMIQELEVLARKHPSLALVSAFTAGFFAGKLFSRR